MKDLYLVIPPYKSITTEEKADFIKKNKENLELPVEGEITDEHIDMMVVQIKNNWNNGGSEYYEMLNQMYKVLYDNQSDSSNY